MPPAASRVSLVRASTVSLEICWGHTPTAQAYLLEVQKSDPPPQPIPTPPQPQAVPATVVMKPAIKAPPAPIGKTLFCFFF